MGNETSCQFCKDKKLQKQYRVFNAEEILAIHVVTSDHFIMQNNKDWAKCNNCGSICLQQSKKYKGKDSYDGKDWGTLACVTVFGVLCAITSGTNSMSMGIGNIGHSNKTKWNHYKSTYNCLKCGNNFEKETKEPRLLSM